MGASIIFPLALNFNNFNSAARFQTSVYEKAGKVLNLAKDSPSIKDITIQGTAAIITIEPFPNNPDEKERLTTELEQATGLQVFLQKTSK